VKALGNFFGICFMGCVDSRKRVKDKWGEDILGVAGSDCLSSNVQFCISLQVSSCIISLMISFGPPLVGAPLLHSSKFSTDQINISSYRVTTLEGFDPHPVTAAIDLTPPNTPLSSLQPTISNKPA
jgi:hypothetical protein